MAPTNDYLFFSPPWTAALTFNKLRIHTYQAQSICQARTHPDSKTSFGTYTSSLFSTLPWGLDCISLAQTYLANVTVKQPYLPSCQPLIVGKSAKVDSFFQWSVFGIPEDHLVSGSKQGSLQGPTGVPRESLGLFGTHQPLPIAVFVCHFPIWEWAFLRFLEQRPRD